MYKWKILPDNNCTVVKCIVFFYLDMKLWAGYRKGGRNHKRKCHIPRISPPALCTKAKVAKGGGVFTRQCGIYEWCVSETIFITASQLQLHKAWSSSGKPKPSFQSDMHTNKTFHGFKTSLMLLYKYHLLHNLSNSPKKPSNLWWSCRAHPHTQKCSEQWVTCVITWDTMGCLLKDIPENLPTSCVYSPPPELRRPK